MRVHLFHIMEISSIGIPYPSLGLRAERPFLIAITRRNATALRSSQISAVIPPFPYMGFEGPTGFLNKGRHTRFFKGVIDGDPMCVSGKLCDRRSGMYTRICE